MAAFFMGGIGVGWGKKKYYQYFLKWSLKWL